MSSHKTSVAMCTYNGSSHLLEQLESIASQTQLPDEIVVCDDASDDQTISLLSTFASRAPFTTRIFCNRHRIGPTKNFERAIQLCEGDIILLSDQDDIWKPSKLQKLSAALRQDADAVYAFSDADMGDEEGRQTGRSLWESLDVRKLQTDSSEPPLLQTLLKRNIVAGATMGFRASFRSAMVPIPDEWMHDYWIAFLGSVFHSAVPVPESLMIYRQHPNQVCGWGKQTLFQVVQESLETNSYSCWSKVAQFQKLLDRILLVSQTVPCPRERIESVEEKVRHLSERVSIRSESGPARISRVIKEVLSGRYKRCSGSWHSVVRDLWPAN